MSPSSRRRFLAQTAALPATALIGGRAARAQGRAADAVPVLDAASTTLRALAEVMLPARELGTTDLDRILRRFRHWVRGIEPVAELDHPYLSTDEIAYGPPDPRPAWGAQLEALELLARRRHDAAFSTLDRDQRERLVREQLPNDLPPAMPHPTAAPHVAIALLAWFCASDEANDLCYRARIGRHECRGLPSAGDQPARLEASPFADPDDLDLGA
jgi:hypothetical protein